MASPHTAADSTAPSWRRYPVGIELGLDGMAHMRVWAPRRRQVAFVETDEAGNVQRVVELEPEGDGYFSNSVDSARDGMLYKLRLDDAGDFPDPVSRFQPRGPHGPSQVVDPGRYRWRDTHWKGVTLAGQVLYELHIGTFTREGTYLAAIEHLRDVAEVGVTVLELMPVAEFGGRFGWGYDGVNLFAPYHGYGQPDDLRTFIDEAHAHGLGVLLDVVYNHLGPDGNYLPEFSQHYFKGSTEWGEALNFDGEHSAPVREFFRGNAAYWTSDFHFDGLRLDATQQIFDESTPHILAEVARTVRDSARGRSTIVTAENEPQQARLVRPVDDGGFALDGVWNDDFQHSAFVAATGRDEAYFGGYRGHPQEFVSGAKYGFLFQGSWLQWQKGRRGSPAFDVAPHRFVNFTQNHDQVANGGSGLRLHQQTSPARYRTLMALLLLSPQTPMLFQGQEFVCSSPFHYFADHEGELAKLVAEGRTEFMGQFVSIATPEAISRLTDPSLVATFDSCKLDWNERASDRHGPALALVRDLLTLRREDETIRSLATSNAPSRERVVDGAVWSDAVFFIRYFGARPELDRLLAVNLGRRVHVQPLAEPLVAPPPNSLWRPGWSSEHPAYGGCGTPSIDTDDGGWWLPAECLVFLVPESRERASVAPHHPDSEKEAREQWKSRYQKTAG